MRRISNLVLLGACALWACQASDDGPKTVGPEVDASGGGGAGGGETPACADGVDNDGDGAIDLDDPGCDSAEDGDETDHGPDLPQCGDGQDNDGDGRVDFPADPGCGSGGDDDESDDPPPPECGDGVDNDGDALVDLLDPGCGSELDNDESDDPVVPQCSDGIDNDNDGYLDFPQDPGCGSRLDTSELDDFVPLPACGDGMDNDRDGYVDLADPGCVSPADPREDDPDEPPICSNNLDDDGDGIIDFPLEPGCASAGDDDENDPPTPPACGNGQDDDGDQLADYPDDPGCAGVGDRDETDPPVAPACSDRVDNDRDGLIDYPEDRGCTSAADGSEAGSCGNAYNPVEVHEARVRGDTRGARFESEGSCGGRGAAELVFVYRVDTVLEALIISTEHEGTQLETVIYVRRACLDGNTEVACLREPINDGHVGNTLRLEAPRQGDYFIFVDGATGASGPFQLSVDEIPVAACRNGVDDDADGRTDYPFDPGCVDLEDRDEADPDPLPECADDEDNDADGLVDFPLDLGCRAASDPDEVDLCGQGLRIFEYPVGDASIVDNTAMGGSNGFSGSCGGLNAAEKVYYYPNPINARLTFSVNHEETAQDTLVYVRSECTSSISELGCATEDRGVQRGRVRVDRAPPGDYFIFVDHPFGQGGPFRLSVEVERLPAGCVDGADNDNDGYIDGDDPGCSDDDDEDERDPPAGEPPAACSNGEDDDGDGVIDYPFDVGCSAKGDPDEEDPEVLPACANGLDDDEDNRTDFPADPGCQARGDDNERNPFPPPQCGNALDDDNDGLTDYPVDPGCDAAGDPSERDPENRPQCADQEDNDRDGLVDWPFDPGCDAAGDRTEQDPVVRPQCSNGQDDDGDGITDFPREPGCAFAADNDEEDPGFQPQCANGRDDDADQRVDWPDDPGCRFAADTNEMDQGPIQPRCSDGVDNDDDGLTDLADLGCVNSRDDDEADPDVPPLCADGVDNDEDGTIDWPDDPGCAAQGDECEQHGFGRCEGLCQDLLANPLHCGRCERPCGQGVQCIEGRCGQLRESVMVCGNTGRNPQEFIRGDLVEAEIQLLVNRCDPDDDTQALLVSRGGLAGYQQNAANIRAWVENGGQLITEYNVTDEVFSSAFQINVAQGARGGSCRDNIQPTVQFTPQDPFWADNEFQPLPANESGCGFSVNAYPGITLLGGWDANTAYMGYRDLGAGRVWALDIDWQDNDGGFTDRSRDMMAYMISGGARGGQLPPCIDGRDNDRDGFIDAEDTGCTDDADEQEGEPPDGPLPACGNGIDDDGDGQTDFPLDPGCVARGDADEADGVGDPPACSNGLDDDSDRWPDYPWDPGCQGRGDNEERDPVRRPTCGNGRDDDGDGRADFPADPGCVSAADQDEEDPAAPPACSNGQDDDRDGISDWPFDRGCIAASDDNERDFVPAPVCSNGQDDDEDGHTDFPRDPGCAWAADFSEMDPQDIPACANGRDDDGDGRVDFPDDPGCRFAAGQSEENEGELPPRCSDGVDNDLDGRVDAQDAGCVNADDDDEDDPDVAPLCGNGADDDRDGLTDWPEDPGCQARGDAAEEQACQAGVPSPLIPANGSLRGATAEDGEDHYFTRCGGRRAPDAVLRYVLRNPADLHISADNPGTDFSPVISVRRDCEEDRSLVACAGDFRTPEPTVVIPDAEPGEYFVIIDGGGPERFVSSGGPIQLPVDPRAFQARHENLDANCWRDGGNDAFDCYGMINFTHANQTQQLDISTGQRDVNIGGYAFTLISDFPNQNVLRVRLLPAGDFDERAVTVAVTGNLGSDGGTLSENLQVAFGGRQLPYLHTAQGDLVNPQGDPGILHFMVVSDPEEIPRLTYAINGDSPTITARDVKLPVTWYIALSYLPIAQVAAGVVEDLEIQAGDGGPDAQNFGNFEVSVSEE